MAETKPKIYSSDWIAETENVGVDDEASLLAGSSPASPPFVRAPVEDRSKYEKLAFDLGELSSDSDKNVADQAEDKTKKKRQRVKGVLHRKKKKTKKSGQDEAPMGYESEDSIGSASDLKADMNDEDYYLGEADKIDDIISESVRTCGSSAYHAECESVATHEDDHMLKKARRQRTKETTTSSSADRVVGHQYGEKPLLLDDELDPEAKPDQTFGDPFVRHQYTTNPIQNNHSSDESQDETVKRNGLLRTEDDVFAMAPFPRPNSPRKSSTESHSSPSVVVSNNLVDIDSSPKFNYAQSTPIHRNQMDFSLALHRPQAQKDLFGATPFQTQNFTNPFNNNDAGETSLPTIYPDFRMQSQAYQSLQFFPTNFSTVSPVNNDDTNQDLFGSVPFDEFTTGFSINNMQRPTSLPLSESGNLLGRPVNILSSTDNAQNLVSLMSPEPLVPENDSSKHKKDKSKYHLINDNCADSINVLQIKISHKGKVPGHKKTPKGKKSSVATTGFANMSFEDFPSDENEEQKSHRIAPFEVIREPEKRFESLKRRSNPFT